MKKKSRGSERADHPVKTEKCLLFWKVGGFHKAWFS